MRRGLFITVEGIEGVGKSTNLGHAQQLLEAEGISCVVTREPGGTPLAEVIREILLAPRAEPMAAWTELLLVFAARAQHVAQVVRPALERGQWVLCDRFTDATYAYQGGGRGLGPEAVAALDALVLDSLCPDCTLLLDAPVAVGLERAGRRGPGDRFERERADFFERVREQYLARAVMEPARFRVIDAARALPRVQAEITDAIRELIARGRAHAS